MFSMYEKVDTFIGLCVWWLKKRCKYLVIFVHSSLAKGHPPHSIYKRYFNRKIERWVVESNPTIKINCYRYDFLSSAFQFQWRFFKVVTSNKEWLFCKWFVLLSDLLQIHLMYLFVSTMLLWSCAVYAGLIATALSHDDGRNVIIPIHRSA